MENWLLNDADRELFDRELADFIPPRVFDAHAHWYSTANFPLGKVPPLLLQGPERTGADAYRKSLDDQMPGRITGGLFFPFPFVGLDVEAENEFLAAELKHWPTARGQMLITPEHDPEYIRQTVRRHGFVGLKCYHVYSTTQPTWNSRIEDFFPESQARIAHEEQLSITLHIVRARALADLANQETIRRYATQFPNMRLILAHAARGFNPHHTVEGIESLRGLSNVWFDTSAVTDSGAFEAVIQTMGHEKLLFGSDFPVSHLRGRCVAIGDSFHWISADNTQLAAPYGDIQLSQVGLESLRTLKLAASSLRLTDRQIEDIFHNNAANLFAIE